jgi:hypothetical protein
LKKPRRGEGRQSRPSTADDLSDPREAY